MSVSISAKIKIRAISLISLIVFLSQASTFADGVTFNQTAPDPGGNPDAQTGLIAGLKLKAISEYLQNYLGSRYSSVEKFINHDFAERYILDYKVGRTADRTQLQVVGNLDSDGLKRWLRTLDVKTRGSSLTPFLVLSSSVPNLPYAITDTSQRIKDSSLAQTLLAEVNTKLQKVNIRLGTADLSHLGLKQPPMSDTDIKTLRDQTGGNSCIWVQFQPCKTCGGMRMDLYFYNLTQGRRLLSRSDDLILTAADLADKTKIRAVLRTPIEQFQSDVEELVSSGMLTSSSYDLTVEQVDSYRTYKQIEASLGRLDFIVQAVLNRSEPKVAGFQVLSPLSAQELSQRLAQENFAGFHLKPVRVDSKSLVVRYSE